MTFQPHLFQLRKLFIDSIHERTRIRRLQIHRMPVQQGIGYPVAPPTAVVQRHLRIGYNRSARLIEAMEKAGLVSTMDARGGREVLARKEEE